MTKKTVENGGHVWRLQAAAREGNKDLHAGGEVREEMSRAGMLQTAGDNSRTAFRAAEGMNEGMQ